MDGSGKERRGEGGRGEGGRGERRKGRLRRFVENKFYWNMLRQEFLRRQTDGSINRQTDRQKKGYTTMHGRLTLIKFSHFLQAKKKA